MKRSSALWIGCLVILLFCLAGSGALILHQQKHLREMELQTVNLQERLQEEVKREESLRAELDAASEEAERLKKGPKGGWQKLERGQDINILIVGDSIGAGAGAGTGEDWESLLISRLHEQYGSRFEVRNVSLGATTSYAGYVCTEMLPEDTDFDLAFICYGYNDAAEDLSREYEAVIRSIRSRYPLCAVVSILESPMRGNTEKIRQIRELSEHYGIPTADTIAAFEESGKAYEELTADLTHPNAEGYRLYADCIGELIEERTEQYAEVSSDPVEPLNSDMEEYEHFYYIPAESGVVSDDGCILEFPFSAKLTGFPGIELKLHPGEKIDIYIDGKKTDYRELHWSEDYTLHTVNRLSLTPWQIEESLQLRFSSGKEAEDFLGFVFTGVQ